MKLPQDFVNSIKNSKGFIESSFVEVHELEQKITSIRINPYKRVELDIETGGKVGWCENGIYLKERPSFTFDPLFHAGCYYVQEAGSMFLEYALRQSVNLNNPLTVLDLCAAPGGKSTLINGLISPESILISNEVIKQRADILSYNLSKWGTCNTAVTNCDPSIFSRLENVFDVIIADVPCSGSGLFRKQPEAINQWSPENVKLCSTRQKRIIADSISALKEGGTLIYSTCSYSVEENEAIIEWMITEFDIEYVNIPVKKEWELVDTGYGFRFYPNLTQSEGFFCAILRKTGMSNGSVLKNKKSTFIPLNKKEEDVFRDKIQSDSNNVVFKFGNNYKLVNSALFNFLNNYGHNLYFKKTGTIIAELKHSDFLPNHDLALSIYSSKDLPRIELDRDEALLFLRKEAINKEAARGIYLMCYKGFGIGWAKILDKRINNYLPKEFRILNSEPD